MKFKNTKQTNRFYRFTLKKNRTISVSHKNPFFFTFLTYLLQGRLRREDGEGWIHFQNKSKCVNKSVILPAFEF